jgi:putative DNA primase/helicase
MDGKADKALHEAIPNANINYAPINKDQGRTDVANAARLAEKNYEYLQWVAEWDKFIAWDGTRWLVDEMRTVERRAKRVSDGLWDELFKLRDGTEAKLWMQCLQWVKYSSSVRGLGAMISLARELLAVSHDDLDADPWLFNVQNGTIDLRTGQLRPHDRADLITKIAPVQYNPAATCPTWERFVSEVSCGNQTLVNYRRRLYGYALTGVIREHVLPFFYGTGANGKSTELQTILETWGDYGYKAPEDLILVKRWEVHPTERAALFGKRLVVCIETEDGRRMAEVQVKELTGGDTVTARRMREDFWSYAPTHKLVVAGNYRPTIRGHDLGIWRRVKLVPFNAVFLDGKADTAMKEKLLAERSGILNWCIAGCLEWQRHGLGEPETVTEQTQNYRQDMDRVGEFVQDYCDVGKDLETNARDLWEAFTKLTGETMSQVAFAERLTALGFRNRDAKGKPLRRTTTSCKGRRYWKGMRLRPWSP